MTTERLWDVLEIDPNKKELILKDLSEGITPELPYFVVGQEDVKNKITEYLEQIDSNYFNRSLLISDYGNGKTNILKYLQLYFQTVNTSVKYIYEVANADKPDVFSMLLELLEFKFKKDLENAIKSSRTDNDFIKEEKSKYTYIQEYIDCLIETEDTEKIEELIYMGTGRYYTKKIFLDYNIPQLTDNHRKEVLVFFLNLLSRNKSYIFFAIDELEKIYEKSKARFRNFLTTFRELIDLSSQIKGHYFISAMVTSVTHFNNALEENPAFYSRIKKDILEVNFLSLNKDKLELIDNITSLLEKTISNADREEVLSKINTTFNRDNVLRSNRYIMQEIFTLLKNNENKEYKDLNLILEEKELNYEFEDLSLDLEVSGAFKRIKDKFINGLRYYFNQKDQDIKQVKDFEYLYSQRKTPIYRYFVFSEEQFNQDKPYLDDLLERDKKVYIFYNQEQHNIKYEYFKKDEQFEKGVTLVNYNIETLLTLFIFLEEEIQYQEDIKEIIEHYTKGAL